MSKTVKNNVDSALDTVKNITDNDIVTETASSLALLTFDNGEHIGPSGGSSKDPLDYDYFDGYGRCGVHGDMLKDRMRTMSYRNCMYYNTHLFKDKIVLDVGCGTGILSMFAAKAGAARVIGVENSSIAEYAKKIIIDNHLDDIVTIVKGKVEEIDLPDNIAKVDIIISEWMGYCLFYKAILDTVIYARDKWLKKDGILCPDRANLFIAGIEDKEYKDVKVTWWKNVYGFDMSAISNTIIKDPIIDYVNPKQVITNSSMVKEINLYSVKKEDLTFTSSFQLIASRKDCMHGLITFFTVEFTKCHKLVGFSTAPEGPRTHWKQTLFYLENYFTVDKKDLVSGTFSMSPNVRNNRNMDIAIDVQCKEGDVVVKESNKYNMR